MKETVVSIGISRTSQNSIEITVRDEHSSDRIMRAQMSLEEYALVVTGLHGVKCNAKVYQGAHIAQKRVTKRVECEKVKSYNKDEQKAVVVADFMERFNNLGYELQDDGVSSRQDGENHEYLIKKYEPVDNPLEVERFY